MTNHLFINIIYRIGKIIQLQQKKKDLSDMFVENNEGSLSQMTIEEIKSLFTM